MIITLTTDFGLKDHYTGALKGLIYSKIPNVNLVDISHQISPFGVHEASYVVGASYRHFPERTLHLILVDAEINRENKPVLVEWDKHYFLSSDNGILSLITHETVPENIISIPFEEITDSTSFFVEKATELINGKSIFDLGQKIETLKEVPPLKATISKDNNRITGNIIHIDHYGNTISNISKELFEQVRNGRNFQILFKSYTITKIHQSYIDYSTEKLVQQGGKIALFNSSDLLEIALYKGNPNSGTASSLLGLDYHSTISVQFL